MFLSFKLQDADSRYSYSERECYAIVKSLAEIPCIVIGSKHPIMVYTDHEVLKWNEKALDQEALKPFSQLTANFFAHLFPNVLDSKGSLVDEEIDNRIPKIPGHARTHISRL